MFRMLFKNNTWKYPFMNDMTHPYTDAAVRWVESVMLLIFLNLTYNKSTYRDISEFCTRPRSEQRKRFQPFYREINYFNDTSNYSSSNGIVHSQVNSGMACPLHFAGFMYSVWNRYYSQFRTAELSYKWLVGSEYMGRLIVSLDGASMSSEWFRALLNSSAH